MSKRGKRGQNTATLAQAASIGIQLPETPEFYSVVHISKLTGLSKRTIYALLGKALPYYRIGRLKLVSRSDLQQFFNDRRILK